MVKFANMASLDFYVKEVVAETAGTFAAREVELPSDIDLESEAMILYGIEHIIQDASTVLTDGVVSHRVFNFSLLEPANENDLDTCFMSKVISAIHDAGLTGFYHEGNVTPFVPIVILTSFWYGWEGITNVVANDEALRIWYDDVPLSRDKMAQLVNILRGEQI